MSPLVIVHRNGSHPISQTTSWNNKQLPLHVLDVLTDIRPISETPALKSVEPACKKFAIPDGFNCGHQGSSTLLAQLWIFWGETFHHHGEKFVKHRQVFTKAPHVCVISHMCDIIVFLQFMVVIPKLYMCMWPTKARLCLLEMALCRLTWFVYIEVQQTFIFWRWLEQIKKVLFLWEPQKLRMFLCFRCLFNLYLHRFLHWWNLSHHSVWPSLFYSIWNVGVDGLFYHFMGL